jgi:multidrug resistance efflux pump
VDGYIKSIERRPGEVVKAGQLLVTLDNTDLAQSLDKWKVEYTKLDREYGDALGQEDAAAIVVARARLAQVKAQVEQSERELARSSLVAPIDGVVVSSGLEDSIGMPVKLGQELVTIAPQGAYRIVAEIDEQDVGMIDAGQTGNVVFAALASQRLPVSVTRISPVARTIDQRNSFEVDAELQNSDVSLYHGLTGVARIDIEQRPLASVLWLRISQRVQRLFWRLVG